MASATLPTLAVDDVTVTTDLMGRPYAVLPDDVAAPLAAASREGVDPNAVGVYFESATHAADSWVATTVRTIFDAVLSSPVAAEDDHAHGLSQYRKWDGGTFYGFIVGRSAWDMDARWWADYRHTRHLHVSGSACIATKDRRALAGTCTFGG
jgi:hypothetical protein